MLLSPPQVASFLGFVGWKSTAYIGCLLCQWICSAFAFFHAIAWRPGRRAGARGPFSAVYWTCYNHCRWRMGASLAVLLNCTCKRVLMSAKRSSTPRLPLIIYTDAVSPGPSRNHRLTVHVSGFFSCSNILRTCR